MLVDIGVDIPSLISECLFVVMSNCYPNGETDVIMLAGSILSVSQQNCEDMVVMSLWL